jgi:hypothetical protein
MSTGRSSLNDESIRAQEAAAIQEEMKLLAPLYGNEKSQSRFIRLAVLTSTTFYQFMDKRPIRWPQIGYSKDWSSAQTIHVAAEVESVSRDATVAFNIVFQEWANSMTAQGQLRQVHPLLQTDCKVEFICEFREACGDAAMALYMLLTDSRKMTFVQSVGFFLSTDTDRRYFPIGRRAKG